MKLSALVVGLTFVASVFWLQEANGQSRYSQTRTTFRMAPMSVHPVGAYGGVQPGVTRAKVYKKRRLVTNKSKRKNVVRWIGFQAKSSGSRVFVQLTGEVEYSQRVDGDTLVVTLAKARLGGRNARRPLDTRFFETVVRRAVAKRVRRRGIELRISFKNPSDAREASASMSKNETDGFTYLFLDFSGTASASDDASDDDRDDSDTDDVSDDDEVNLSDDE